MGVIALTDNIDLATTNGTFNRALSIKIGSGLHTEETGFAHHCVMAIKPNLTGPLSTNNANLGIENNILIGNGNYNGISPRKDKQTASISNRFHFDPGG